LHRPPLPPAEPDAYLERVNAACPSINDGARFV